ncbi:metallophosphoesterase [Nesterenkonia alba]|uniref:metallophosphoesterase n=1 Tax=Nesterenkonia alba TaxID=515814 RepID=UPI0003B4239A|nr:metallophosphoesterase [Nesterenkonia alba]
MATFFTSDPHFGHANIIRYCDRPFRDVQEMDEVLISRWNDVVGPDDEVWVLGDYAMGDRSRGLGYLTRMNGTKYLVAGNHDRCSPTEKTGHLHIQEYLDAGFSAVVSQARTSLPPYRRNGNGLHVVLSHYPYTGDSHTEEDRYAQFRLRDLGTPLICGHVHDSWKSTHSPRGTVQVNVGVDVWDFTPVSAEDLHRFIVEQG